LAKANGQQLGRIWMAPPWQIVAAAARNGWRRSGRCGGGGEI